jgi:hypothetical protein
VVFIAPIPEKKQTEFGMTPGQMDTNKSSTTKQRLFSNVQQVFEFNASRTVFTTGSSSCFADWTFW